MGGGGRGMVLRKICRKSKISIVDFKKRMKTDVKRKVIDYSAWLEV